MDSGGPQRASWACCRGVRGSRDRVPLTPPARLRPGHPRQALEAKGTLGSPENAWPVTVNAPPRCPRSHTRGKQCLPIGSWSLWPSWAHRANRGNDRGPGSCPLAGGWMWPGLVEREGQPLGLTLATIWGTSPIILSQRYQSSALWGGHPTSSFFLHTRLSQTPGTCQGHGSTLHPEGVTRTRDQGADCPGAHRAAADRSLCVGGCQWRSHDPPGLWLTSCPCRPGDVHTPHRTLCGGPTASQAPQPRAPHRPPGPKYARNHHRLLSIQPTSLLRWGRGLGSRQELRGGPPPGLASARGRPAQGWRPFSWGQLPVPLTNLGKCPPKTSSGCQPGPPAFCTPHCAARGLAQGPLFSVPGSSEDTHQWPPDPSSLFTRQFHLVSHHPDTPPPPWGAQQDPQRAG